ncbi:ComF family protein [Acidaminobacter hydrogenoformans]|uniref:ComF family protein n=1 Tax=Acidaminobacter hydrogenoformans DSM 2784 TaxID=1120920 RepID=A0A1G5S2N6_9FIRM|nr:ComF family protein [Acidaminobacter hydrogenoformans]SCZ80556.1 comF family protein [Acidaminobacter hydrogenoformans DSM 2784]
MNNDIKLWLRLTANFWFPRGVTCVGCGEDIFEAPYGLCESCLNALELIRGRVCRRCGRPLHETSTTLCYACFGKRTSFRGNVAVAAYSPLAQQLIFRFKYKDHRYIGYHLAQMMAALLRTTWISDVDCIVAVPSSRRRIRQRGYCQMALIAASLSEMTGLDNLSKALVRIKDTPRMKKLNRENRSQALKGCFSVKWPLEVTGRSVLLIDDIMTTGSTLEVCAQSLLEAGASEVWTMTFATVYDNQPSAGKGVRYRIRRFLNC